MKTKEADGIVLVFLHKTLTERSFKMTIKKKSLFHFLLFFTLGLFTSVCAMEEEIEQPLLPEEITSEDCDVSPDCSGAAKLEYKYVGGDYGSWVYLVNKSSKSISVTIRTRWIYQEEQREQYDVYRLHPKQRKVIGTTHWKNQKFSRDIMGCESLD